MRHRSSFPASRLLAFPASLFLTFLLALPAFADSQARIVRLSQVDGNVQIDRRTGDGFESALENLPIAQGTRLATKDDGRVEIELEDGSTVRLAPNSSLEFTRLSLRDSGGKNTELDLTEGTAYFNIDLAKHDDFVVDLGHRSIHLERSARFRASVDSSQARIAVSHGQVDVLGASSDAVTISKNRTVSFDLFNLDNFTESRNYEDGPYDDWNDDLDSYHRHNYRHESDSPYAYGFSDLNYYGSYIADPGFGSCWRPYFASYGWDPFADGTWVWYPSFGYTWVSAYPWGWAPYRYGSWNFLQSSGWCWQPGAWNQLVVVPRFVNTPPGWKPPVPPANGRGRVPRLRGNPVGDNDLARRFGDPHRRVVRETTGGDVIRSQQPGSGNVAPAEAGLGVPRGRVNLGRLQTPPQQGLQGVYYEDGRRSPGPMGRQTPPSAGGDHSARPTPPRSAPPAPAPRMSSPPPAPRSAPAPPPRPAPAPRGGHGKN